MPGGWIQKATNSIIELAAILAHTFANVVSLILVTLRNFLAIAILGYQTGTLMKEL
jgi:hypothetical protein